MGQHLEAFHQTGAIRFAAVLSAEEQRQLTVLSNRLPARKPGLRLSGDPVLVRVLDAGGPVGRLAACVLGPSARPVRALLFNKTAEAGDVWLYATPILHASERAAIPAQRRVIQVDYATIGLPGRLEWLGLNR